MHLKSEHDNLDVWLSLSEGVLNKTDEYLNIMSFYDENNNTSYFLNIIDEDIYFYDSVDIRKLFKTSECVHRNSYEKHIGFICPYEYSNEQSEIKKIEVSCFNEILFNNYDTGININTIKYHESKISYGKEFLNNMFRSYIKK